MSVTCPGGQTHATAEPIRHPRDRSRLPILGMRTMEAFYDANAQRLNRVIVALLAGMVARAPNRPLAPT